MQCLLVFGLEPQFPVFVGFARFRSDLFPLSV